MCKPVCPYNGVNEKTWVCMLIYDAVLVINMALLSHLDAVIDTWSGQHMERELELKV